MRVIALIGQKGGPGKTMVATNLAVEAAEDGETVVLIDLDPQASASQWGDRRQAENVVVQSVQAARLGPVLKTARAQGVTLVIIDTPGRAADLAIAAARVADLVIVPVRPTISDLETMPAVLDLLHTARAASHHFAVINAAPAQGTRHTEAKAAIEGRGFVCSPVVLYQRNAYGDAPVRGLGVTEYAPRDKAATETRELYRFAIELLNQQTETSKPATQ